MGTDAAIRIAVEQLYREATEEPTMKPDKSFTVRIPEPAMTLREYVATHVLAGLTANPRWAETQGARGSTSEESLALAASYSVRHADALLAELAKPAAK